MPVPGIEPPLLGRPARHLVAFKTEVPCINIKLLNHKYLSFFRLVPLTFIFVIICLRSFAVTNTRAVLNAIGLHTCDTPFYLTYLLWPAGAQYRLATVEVIEMSLLFFATKWQHIILFIQRGFYYACAAMLL